MHPLENLNRGPLKCMFFKEKLKIKSLKIGDQLSDHYIGKVETIDFIEDKGLGFNLGNTVKYIARAGKKDPNKRKEDLEKALDYLHREIYGEWFLKEK